MGACFCTGRCREGGTCAAHPTGTVTTSNTIITNPPATPAGWYCAGCGSYHAPSVATCPNGAPKPWPNRPTHPWVAPPTAPKRQFDTIDCGCPLGRACMNTACPRAVKFITNG